MRIKMLRSMSGTDTDKDGCAVGPNTYEQGKEYDVGITLAKALVEELKAAEYVKEKSSQINEEKSSGEAPENKSLKPEKGNKVGPKARNGSK